MTGPDFASREELLERVKRAEAERDQWKNAANGDRDGLVTHEYHQHVIRALVAERDEALEALARIRDELLPAQAEATHGATANARFIDGCVDRAIALLPENKGSGGEQTCPDCGSDDPEMAREVWGCCGRFRPDGDCCTSPGPVPCTNEFHGSGSIPSERGS